MLTKYKRCGNMRTVSKEERNQQIISLCRNNPRLTLQAIAVMFGLSREWVRKILLSAGIKTSRQRVYGKVKQRICPECHGVKSKGKLCRSCYMKTRRVSLRCDNCGTPFPIRKAYLLTLVVKKNQRNFFCSVPCYKEYLRHKFVSENRYDGKGRLDNGKGDA